MSEQASEEATPEEVQDQLDSEGQLTEALDELSDEVPDEYPLIDNDCWVTVQLKVRNFSGSPEDAVSAALLDFITFGLYDRVVMVHDPATETDYAVSEGRTLTNEEIDELRKES